MIVMMVVVVFVIVVMMVVAVVMSIKLVRLICHRIWSILIHLLSLPPFLTPRYGWFGSSVWQYCDWDVANRTQSSTRMKCDCQFADLGIPFYATEMITILAFNWFFLSILFTVIGSVWSVSRRGDDAFGVRQRKGKLRMKAKSLAVKLDRASSRSQEQFSVTSTKGQGTVETEADISGEDVERVSENVEMDDV